MNDQVKTDIRDMAAEQRRQGETVEELAVDLVNKQQIDTKRNFKHLAN